MNKDLPLSLKSNKEKLILLMLGNDGSGKKSIIKKWINSPNISKSKSPVEENRSFYKTVNLIYDYKFDNQTVEIPVEIRVMNGDEIETDLKINANFFKGAYGAFIVTNITDFMSFQE